MQGTSSADQGFKVDPVAPRRLSRLLELVGDDLIVAVRVTKTDEGLAELAARISSVLPHEDPTAEAIGPVYETSDLVSWLGITRQALHKRVQRHDVLAMKTGDGHTIYPAWQFAADGMVRPGVSEAVMVLSPVMDDWMRALWFAGATPELENMSAARWLSDGGDPGVVVACANRTVRRMAR